MSATTVPETVLIDLKVDRSLLNANFDSYRVSIDPMVTYSESLAKNSINEFKLSEDDYSYISLSMASQFNHLFADPYCPQTVFLTTSNGQIVCVGIELLSGKLSQPKVVYSIADFESGLISLSFPNNSLALIAISNPKKRELYVVSTPSRSATEPWIHLMTIDLSDYEIKNLFQLTCSQSIDMFNNFIQMDCILSFVDNCEEKNCEELDESSHKSPFCLILNWLTIIGNIDESNTWKVKRCRRLKGSDWPKYLAFDLVDTPYVCMISEKDFKFIYDSDKPIVESELKINIKSEPNILYTYCQSLEDICVTFKLPVQITKHDIFIDLKPNKFLIKIKEVIEFEGDLWHTIDSNSSVWTIQSQSDYQLLEITVNKSENGLIWHEFIKDDKQGQEIINKQLVEEIQQKLKHLTSDMSANDNDFHSDVYNPMGLEECDFTDNSLVFNRYNGDSHLISHKIDLTGSQWLFTIATQKSFNSDCSELPYFVVRHDVDAIVWSPQSAPEIEQFNVTHVATFAAFGYVSASKTNTRFIVAPDDCSYVAIADGVRHIYLYRQPVHIKSGELRNRKTGKDIQKVAKQHVISLNDCHFILGIHAINDSIFVLTNDKIFLIKL